MSEVQSRMDSVGIDRELSRRNFLKTAAWTGAALSAAGIGGFGVAVRKAHAVHEGYAEAGPVAIVTLAYQLELLEGTFYAEGVNAGIFDKYATTQLATIRDHEMAHADALAGILGELGAEVPATPEFTFPEGTFTDPVAFLELAATLEPVGIGAYQGAAPALIGSEYLPPALSIHNAECMHWNAIKILQGVVPSNNVAFEEALPLADVQAAAAPFGLG
ncbi:MAG: ferritin-like domain-containing protein [Rubrobacteraceae bacterium]